MSKHGTDIQKSLTKKLLKQWEDKERARNPDVIRRVYNPPVELRVGNRNRYWRD
jgi:hypothetical protein